jgi:hypothetical protein
MNQSPELAFDFPSPVPTGCTCGLCEKKGPHIHKRSPSITLELPIWPPPPVNARPYWCYIHTLIFFDESEGGWREVWRRDFTELTRLEDRFGDLRVRVRKDERGFGWLLVVEVWHDVARNVLRELGLSEPRVAPAPIGADVDGEEAAFRAGRNA